MTSRRIRALAILAAGAVALTLLGPRARVRGRADPVDVPDDVEEYLRVTEAAIPGIREGDQKRIVWASPESPAQTPLAVVYLHGFSADPHELDPVPQRLADSLGANVFVTRLAGHGLQDGSALGDATASDWLRDTEEALSVGRRLGGKVVLIGTSTGGTLAAWAVAQPRWRDDVAAVIMVSPNFGPRDPDSEMLLWPWGGLLARLFVGKERCWTPVSAEQERHWTTCYPTRALLPMMALVDLARRVDAAAIRTPMLVLYSAEDHVVDPEATQRFAAGVGSTAKEVIAVTGDGDPSHHVLGGDILSPVTTDLLVTEMLRFVRAHPPSAGTLP